MSGAVCPSCGVAVVPGYVRCPKCHKPLPRHRATHMEGGTAVETKRRFPLVVIIAALVLGAGIIVFFAVRKDKPAAQPATTAEPEQPITPETTPTPDQPEAPAGPTAPDAQTVAAELERALKKNRLWSTVSVVGDHVDVRSGSCDDKEMVPLLDGAAPSFKAAGLTRIRCLEQSGRVVSERDL